MTSHSSPLTVDLATAELDLWGDPQGSFLAARHADPVHRLFGRTGLGVKDMPAVNTPVGRDIGVHVRSGRQGQTAYDWWQYLAFASRHWR